LRSILKTGWMSIFPLFARDLGKSNLLVSLVTNVVCYCFQASFVLHVFPPCDFTHSHLSRVAPNLLDSATDSGHLMVVVATV
jgi:hypothetical protein